MMEFTCAVYESLLKILRCGNEPELAKSRLVAVCEVGPNGKPCGTVASKAAITPLHVASTTTRHPESPRNKVQQFAPVIASRVSGKVTLTQEAGGTVIEYDIVGLSRSQEHGFHINEFADFSNGCISAGPIYNPFGCDHGGLDDEVRKVGDLGNIIADDYGHAKGKLKSSLVKLTGPTSVIGRSIMVHADRDDLGKGDNSKAHLPGPPKNGYVSKITGNAGSRLACGEIKWVDDATPQ